MRRTALLVTMTALAIGLAGCSSETPGDATPGDDTGGGGLPSFSEDPTTGGNAPSSSTEDPGSGTADLQPCDLLSAQDLTTLGLPGTGQEQEVGPARSCQWQTSGASTVTVGVIDALGIDQVVSSGEKESVTVGSHDAVRYTVGSGTCALAIEVTNSSRVDVLGGAGGDMTRACDVANQAAEFVEAKLP